MIWQEAYGRGVLGINEKLNGNIEKCGVIICNLTAMIISVTGNYICRMSVYVEIFFTHTTKNRKSPSYFLFYAPSSQESISKLSMNVAGLVVFVGLVWHGVGLLWVLSGVRLLRIYERDLSRDIKDGNPFRGPGSLGTSCEQQVLFPS